MAAFVTRRAGIQDVEALLWIQRQAAIAAFSHIFPQNRYPFPSEAIRDGWATALGDAEVEAYLAEVEARPVASVSIGHGFLRTLFVLPSHWGMGIGSELHDLALARLRARGVAEARLWTLADSESARRFYERRGWIETGETQVVPFPPHPLDVEYSLSLLGEA